MQLKYNHGEIILENKIVTNVHKPFGKAVDKQKRKASLAKLRISPDETLECPQMKKFLVYSNKRYANKLFNSYKESLKCHHIYRTTSDINKILKLKALETIKNADVALQTDLMISINVLIKSWGFDAILTDLPWIKNSEIPVLSVDWNLLSSDNESLSLIIEKLGKVPLRCLDFNCFNNCNLKTDIPELDYRCPLILLNTNSNYAAFLRNTLGCGLPTTVFKI